MKSTACQRYVAIGGIDAGVRPNCVGTVTRTDGESVQAVKERWADSTDRAPASSKVVASRAWKVATTAPTFRQVERILWSELRKAYHRAPGFLGGELTKTRLELRDVDVTPGAGESTVNAAVPNVARSIEGMVTINTESETKEVSLLLPFNCTVDDTTNPDPVTVTCVSD